MGDELKRAYDALEKADAEGNEEDAKQLAQYIRTLEEATPEEKPATELDVSTPAVGGALFGATTGALTGPGAGAAIDFAAETAAKGIAPNVVEKLPEGAAPDAVKRWLAKETNTPYAGGVDKSEAFKKAEIAGGKPVESRGSQTPIRRGNLSIQNQPAPTPVPTKPQMLAEKFIQEEKLKAAGIPRRILGMGLAGGEAGKFAQDIKEGNYGQAGLSGAGTLAGLATQSRHPKLRGAGTALSVAIPAVQYLTAPKTKEDKSVLEEKASGGVVGFKAGGKASLLETAMGYLKHEPKKPHPDVGTRFERELVGELAPRTTFDFAKNKGASVLVKPWDSQSRGQQIKSVSGIPLTENIVTEGGNQFALDINNIANKIGGASNEEIAKRIVNRANIARKENELAGGTGQVFHSPITMGARGEDFSYTPTAVLSDLIKQREFNPTDMATLNNLVRGYNIPGKGRLFENFVGFNDPRFTEQVLQGGHGLETTPGNLRKAIMDRGSLKGSQKLINYNEEDLRNALLNENLQGLGKGFTGDTLIEALPGKLTPSSHSAYSHEYPGLYAGSSNSMPVEVVAPDVFETIFQQLQAKYPHKDYASLRQDTIGAMEKRNKGVSQVINNRVVDTTGAFEEGLKAGKFEPGDIGGALEHVYGVNPYKGGFEGKFAEGGLTTPDEV